MKNNQEIKKSYIRGDLEKVRIKPNACLLIRLAQESIKT
jgi:hypothetical protein